MDEYKLLIHILEFCEENGNTYKNVHFDINHELVEELYDRYGIQPSVDELKAIADRCYAREWIEKMYIGSGRHNGLKLTAKGIGVAISKRKSDEIRKSRSFFKRTSDYIEDHKGIFVLLGSLIALIGLVVTILSKGGSNG